MNSDEGAVLLEFHAWILVEDTMVAHPLVLIVQVSSLWPREIMTDNSIRLFRRGLHR